MACNRMFTRARIVSMASWAVSVSILFEEMKCPYTCHNQRSHAIFQLCSSNAQGVRVVATVAKYLKTLLGVYVHIYINKCTAIGREDAQ